MKYILDTNILLRKPEFVEENEVIFIPHILRELEQLELKRTNYDLQYRIREAKRYINQNLDNVEFLDEVDYKILTQNILGYESDYVDNILLAYVVDLKEQCLNEDICVYTDDVLLKIKLKAHNIPVVSSDSLHNGDCYAGIITFYYDNNNDEHVELLASIYSGEHDNPFELEENQYLIIVDKNKGFGEEIPIDIFQCINDEYYSVMNKKHKLMSVHNDGTDIMPRNIRQSIAIHALKNPMSPIKALWGPAGSGKDFLIFHHAMESYYREDVNKIVWVANNVNTKDSKEIGFLPGEQNQKLRASYAPLEDILGSSHLVDNLISDEIINIVFIGSIRSRTFDNSYIIVPEAQNYTKEQLKLILGRVGKNSTIVFNGDFTQSDINNSGLMALIDALKGDELYSQIELTEVERSEVAELSLLL